MKIKYLKRLQSFGGYQASRVIWITTLKDELLMKFNILDKDGILLYQISERPEYEEVDLIDYSLSNVHLKEIGNFFKEDFPEIEYDWDDQEEKTIILGYFGEFLARRHWLARDSKKCDDIIVDFTFSSSTGESGESASKVEYIVKGTTEDEIIENILLPRLMERERLDRIFVNIAEAGAVNSYLITVQEDK
ncbi:MULTISPECIES: hypothetical protein [Enterococcus]|uniref:Uncharacterized protein n=1 Tax=Candidatus Enterococcus murrayae TaxID=2815321 RepID=A0ABS3HFM9_9ENTE|nr:hypothetical protein [Enterococcus sp. MJM16]MBO0452263.1 hypothetical protein [Enterococcus sp. MJM16]